MILKTLIQKHSFITRVTAYYSHLLLVSSVSRAASGLDWELEAPGECRVLFTQLALDLWLAG